MVVVLWVVVVVDTRRVCDYVVVVVSGWCRDVVRRGVDPTSSTSSGDADPRLRSALLAASAVRRPRPVASLLGVDRLRLRQQRDRQPDVSRPRHLSGPAAAAASAAVRGRPDVGRPADSPSTVHHPVTRLDQPTVSASTKTSLLAPASRLGASDRQQHAVEERPILRLWRSEHPPVYHVTCLFTDVLWHLMLCPSF